MCVYIYIYIYMHNQGWLRLHGSASSPRVCCMLTKPFPLFRLSKFHRPSPIPLTHIPTVSGHHAITHCLQEFQNPESSLILISRCPWKARSKRVWPMRSRLKVQKLDLLSRCGSRSQFLCYAVLYQGNMFLRDPLLNHHIHISVWERHLLYCRNKKQTSQHKTQPCSWRWLKKGVLIFARCRHFHTRLRDCTDAMWKETNVRRMRWWSGSAKSLASDANTKGARL